MPRQNHDWRNASRRKVQDRSLDGRRSGGRRRGDSHVDDQSYVEGQFVRPYLITASAKDAVRDFAASPHWCLERRRGSVRPPLQLPSGDDCVVADLGECGDRKCGNYRLGKYSDVRPDFLDYCVQQIRKLPAKLLADGIVLCSLGSGQLLLDWELLERLTQGPDSVRILRVHLIDQDYGGPKRRDSAIRAQRIVAGWFADKSIAFQSFLSAPSFQRWALKHEEVADVVLDCDAVGARKRIDVTAFRLAVMAPAAIWLCLSNPAKRTLYVNVDVEDSEDSRDCEQVIKREEMVYRHGEWRHPKSVSASRSPSRRRRRSRSRRRRRSGSRLAAKQRSRSRQRRDSRREDSRTPSRRARR